MTYLKMSTATMLAIASFAMFSPTAQAAVRYNCANPTGCKLVKTQATRSTLTATKYPVVMAHGLGGWTTLFGILDYYNGIPEALMEGGTDVFTTKTSAVNRTEVRGEQLLTQVETIRALTGKEKVNLFGHSHGGLDIRYVASVAPEYVASATAVASPMQGVAMADFIVKSFEEGRIKEGLPVGEHPEAGKAAIAFFKFVGEFMDVGSGIPIKDIQEQDGFGAISTLTTDYIVNTFNVNYPGPVADSYCGQPPANNVVDGVAYYSFSGVGAFYNPFDPFDYVMSLTSIVNGNDPNDGLISACSSRLGHVIRDDYPMNHLDSVNQLLGLVAWGRVEPLTIYRNQVGRLKNQGF